MICRRWLRDTYQYFFFFLRVSSPAGFPPSSLLHLNLRQTFIFLQHLPHFLNQPINRKHLRWFLVFPEPISLEGVESILDHMLIAVSDDLGDEGPSRTVLFIKLQHIDIFRRSPFSFCDSGIQMIDPSFAALMRSPQKMLLKQTKRN